jgi:hypothetical protein
MYSLRVSHISAQKREYMTVSRSAVAHMPGSGGTDLGVAIRPEPVGQPNL